MNLLGTPEFKVGALVIVISGLIGVMCLKLAQGPGMFGRSKKHFFVVDNAGGLVNKSAVKMAGIRVGEVDDIVLEGGRAKVKLVLDPDTALTTSAKVEMRSDGILGDKHVELIPGNEKDPPLGPDDPITVSTGGGGMDDLMAEAKKVAVALNELLGTLNKAAKEGDASTPVGRIILNVEKLSADLKDITGENKEKINDIVDRLRNISKNFDSYINEESLASVDRSLKNIEEISDKINKGQGTLGRLINDDQTVEKLDTAIDNVNRFLGTANQLQTSMDFHSEYLEPLKAAKSYFGVKLQPGLDRYYEIYAIDDPKGVKSTTIYSTQQGQANPQQTTTVTTAENELKFTVTFAKNFYDFTIKGGLIESSGGFGVDYHMFDKKFTLMTEFFNFSSVYVRAWARYNFYKGFYVESGGDNIAKSNLSTENWFVGAGFFITNDDLKMLAARISL